MKKFVDRISFPTEYNDISDLRISIALLFILCVVYFTISSWALTINLFLFSKTLLTGTIAYEFILFYLLDKYTDELIKRQVKGHKVKRTLSVTSTGVFALLIVLTFIALIYTMTLPAPVENKFLSLLLSLIFIVIPTFFWDELVHFFKKKDFKGLRFVIILFLLLTPVMAVNDSINDTVSTVSDNLGTISRIISYTSTFKGYVSSVQGFLQSSFNLTQQQTQLITLIGVLITVFMLLKFLSVIVKWVIIILIVWIIIQMFL